MDTIRMLEIKVEELTEVVHSLTSEVYAMRQGMQEKRSSRELWTIRDVMEYGHCGRTYIQQLLARGDIFTKARKEGRKWLFDPEQVKRHFKGY